MTEAPQTETALSRIYMDGEEDHQTVELARQEVHLSVENEDPPYIISGIAIGEGDVTLGQSGTKKKWPRQALEPAAESLTGRPLVEDHNNSSRGVVGEVANAEYEPGVGVLYEAELYDEELAEKIENGLLEVSIRGYHGDAEEMAEDPDTGAKVVEKTVFDNLSIVPTGAAPSNTVEVGPSMEMSAAECADLLGSDTSDDEQLNEPETPLDDETEDASSRGAGQSGEPEPTATDTTTSQTMTDELEDKLDAITEELTDLREQTVTEAELGEKLDEVAEAGEEQNDEDEATEAELAEELKEEFSDDLAELKERTQILDEVPQEQVEDLRDADDPKVVEASEHESSQESLETVRDIYAEALAAHVDVDEERILDKWSLDEMKEDLEAEVEDVEEELSPGRKAEDVDEEDLEEAAEEAREADSDEAELEAEIEEEQDRLRKRIVGDE